LGWLLRRWREIASAGSPARRWGLAVLVVLALAAVGLGLWLRSLQPEDPTWDRMLETGILRVCTDPSWLPFEVADPTTGRIEGLDADLARLLAERLAPGMRAEFVTVGFDSLYDALMAGRCDAILSALPHDPARTEDVGYSAPYFDAGVVLVAREGTSDIAGLDDLEGRVTGVEWGFVPEGSSRQRLFLSSLRLRRYDSASYVLRALSSGELDAALVDHVSALVFLRQCPGLQIVGEPISGVPYVIPVRPGSTVLLEQINRVLLEMRQDGTLQNLQDKWF
jgi:ABC-type amino acid transport substrate-binding protein